MKKVPKRMMTAREGIPEGCISISDAVSEVKSRASAKFDESVTMDICTCINPKDSSQSVRGVVHPPFELGKPTKVCVIAQGSAAEAAKTAGADFVGFDDIISDITKDGAFFDCCISTTSGMQIISKVARILGPRGLMPNPKMGTVVSDDEISNAVKKAKAGRIEYKSDSYGMLHCSIGRVSLPVDSLISNATSVLEDVLKARPSTLKGSRYITRAFMSSTMGPSVKLDISEIK